MSQGDEAELQPRKQKRPVVAARARAQRRDWSPSAPPKFWNDVPLSHRALQEHNSRTVLPSKPKSPVQLVLESDLVPQLRHFARQGGPSLHDIIGYSNSETAATAVRKMNLNRSRGSCRTKTRTDFSGVSSRSKPRRALARNTNFQQKLINANIYPPNYSDAEPGNMDELVERLGQRRRSLSPPTFSPEQFLAFQRENDAATSEDKVRSDVIPLIAVGPSNLLMHNRRFTNLATMTNDTTLVAQPDYYEGSHATELNLRVRNDLNPYIAPSTRLHEPLLPNFFMEINGPDGNASRMKLQATYDAAHGARAMLEILSYGQDGYTYDGRAYTFAATYHSGTGTLQIYAMHPTEPAELGGRPQYHMTQLDTFGMTGNKNTHLDGRYALRNARELAQEYRTDAIARANEKAKEIQESAQSSSFTAEITTLASDTSL